ncbi:MAG: peptidoglycan DD-metalloendopeptidase family protein [Mariprofundaceae bacterium]
MMLASQAWAERNIQSEIDGVRQERVRLLEVRKSLEIKLGSLGRQMRGLDAAVVVSRKALRLAQQQWHTVDKKVIQLVAQRKSLKIQIRQLQQHMQDEANAAWRRANRKPSWLDVWAGVSVVEIPHRQYMVKLMLDAQQKDRVHWQQSLLDLKAVESQLLLERESLLVLKNKKRNLQLKARKRLQAKRSKVQSVRRDMVLKKKQAKALKYQEKALLQLLNGLKGDLLSSDKVISHVSIRKRKGRLSWPLKGRIVNRFGSRSDMQHAKLLGVRIAPVSNNQKAVEVHALAAGQVRYADWFGGFGLMLVIEYGDGIMAVYAHNNALQKQLGDWVEAGEVIAEAGSTGFVGETRLYFELRDKGKAVNPARWCKK